MSARELAHAIRTKLVSPVEVANAVLNRVDAVNPVVNALVTLTYDSTLEAAREAEAAVMRGDSLGPLHGVPFSVKDTTQTAGVRTTMGSRLLQDNVPVEDAVLVERLKRAGAVLIGKTNTPEFACKAVTDNLLFGPTLNPWKLDRTPGGSSGGAAAAVASGMGPLATGNDAGGSIRIPASCCGVIGLKPQFGRVPSYPYFEHWETMSHEGPIARTVVDCALMLDATAGPHWGDRLSLPPPAFSYVDTLTTDVSGLRIAFSVDLGYALVSGDVRRSFLEAVAQLDALRADIEEDGPELGSCESISVTLINAELAAMLARYGAAADLPGNLHPLLRARVAAARNMTAQTYLHATFQRREVAVRVGRFFDRYDVLVTPTLGTTAWSLNAPGGYVNAIDGYPVQGLQWSLNHPFNLTGHPAISIPWGMSTDGLPIGIQIIGQSCAEHVVLRVAAALEQARPWADRKPKFNQ